MKQNLTSLVLIFISAAFAHSQPLQWNNRGFNASLVKASPAVLNGESVLRVERDLNALPFDVNRLESTVDEPTFVKLEDLNMADGTVEVKVLSRLQEPLPFAAAQGFIGIAFRINGSNTAFECIYLRPRIGRSDNQLSRNHAVQYFSYPDFKFQTLRNKEPGRFETSSPIGLNEWITMRIEFRGERAELFLNDARYSTLIVDKLKGSSKTGSIGLWVDIGTIGYFKDLKVTPH